MDRLRQIRRAYQLTAETDPRLPLWLAIAFLVPTVAGVVGGALTGLWVVWAPSGVLLGLTAAMFVFGRRLQRAQFMAIEGVPGAAAAVIDQMRGQWFLSAGVGVTKQQEMVHRVVGRCGVVLVTEGGTGQRVDSLVQRERKKIRRVAGDTPIHVVHTGDGEGDTVTLTKLQIALSKLPGKLSKSEVPQLARRLAPLDKGNVPMPKGYIPRGRPR